MTKSVVSLMNDGIFEAAALRKESTNSDNRAVQESVPLLMGRSDGNLLNGLCIFGKP